MTLTLRALRLRGFGRFGDVRAEFSPGLNVLVRPNEWGKSTLLFGVEAALFGLYSHKAPGRPTARWAKSRERFRNWYSPPAFDAVLVFELDGRLYQLYRDFDGFRVMLRSREGRSVPPDALEPPAPPRSRRASAGWVQLFNGLHNPGGDKTSAPFEGLLLKLVGISTSSLFEQIFCVTQRLPETDQLDGEVQALITGAGTAGLEGARQWLASRAKALTMRTGELGLTPGNGQKPQRAELIAGRLQSLKQKVAAEVERLDRAHQIKQALAEAEASTRRAQEEHDRTQRLVQAWRAWILAYQRRRQLLARAAELETAIRRARGLGDRAAELVRQINAEWAELSDLPEDASLVLERLASFRGSLAQARARVEAIGQALARLETDRAELLRRMQQEYGEWWQREDLAEIPARHEQLARRAAELAELEAHLEHLRREQDELRERLRQLPDWSPWLPAPAAEVAHMREQAERLAAAWDELQQVRRRIQETEELLRRRFDVLEALDEPTRELVRSYDATLRTLRLARERTAAKLESSRQRLAALEKAQAELSQDWADVMEWQRRWGLASPAEVADRLRVRFDQVRRRGELSRRQQELAKKLSAVRRRRRRQAWAAAGALALVAAAAVWGGAGRFPETPALPPPELSGVAAAVGLAGAAASAAFLWLRRRGLVPLQALGVELQSARAEAERLAQDLAADHLPDDEGRLAAMAERAAACGREWRRLSAEAEELRRFGITPQALADLEREAAASEEGLASFLARTARVRERFGESGVAAAWTEWNDARARLAHLREARDRLAAGPLRGHEALREWLLTAAQAAGLALTVQDVSAPESLAAWLKEVPAGFWEKAGHCASEWSRIRDRLAAIEVEQKAAARADPLHEEIERLRREVLPFDEKATPELVARQVQACLEARAELERMALHSASLHEEGERLTAQIQAAEAELRALEGRLAPLLVRAGGDLSAARQLLDARARQEAQLRDLQRELAGLLSGHEVDSVAALEARRLSLDQQVRAETEAMERLRLAFPALPTPEDDRRAAELQQEFDAYEARERELRQQVAAAQEEQVRLSRTLASLEGAAAVNVAQAELEIMELEREQARVEQEIQALALAFRWLNDAAAGFQAEFREQLEREASAYFSRFTGVEGRRVIVDDAFRLKVAEPDGQEVVPAVLSQGARDQLYLALRFAMAAMVHHRMRLPFIMDDPFLNCDAGRLRSIRQALEQVAGQQQVLVLSHREELSDWGAEVSVEER
ncbi:MAG: AAA family ATPase [Bacillota bacterium]